MNALPPDAEDQIARWLVQDKGIVVQPGACPEWDRWLRRMVRLAIVFHPDRPYPTASRERRLYEAIRARYSPEALEAAYLLGGHEALTALALKYR